MKIPKEKKVQATTIPVNPKEVILLEKRVLHRVHTIHTAILIHPVEVNLLKESTYQTPCGTIHYWSSILSLDTTTLVFLPGLTADHRLFDKQVEYFDGKYNIIVWDAPAHASSWPFRFDFDLFDKAKWLNGILEKEEIIKPIIIGQSMGGYVGQAYAQLYPDQLAWVRTLLKDRLVI